MTSKTLKTDLITLEMRRERLMSTVLPFTGKHVFALCVVPCWGVQSFDLYCKYRMILNVDVFLEISFWNQFWSEIRFPLAEGGNTCKEQKSTDNCHVTQGK